MEYDTIPVQGRVGLWIELEMDWPPQPLHSCVPGTVTHDKGPTSKLRNEIVLAERKLTSYVSAVDESLQSWYQSGSLLPDFTVRLPSPPSFRRATTTQLDLGTFSYADDWTVWTDTGLRAMSASA
ncbi:hypothetical protein TIFTF001_043983 [Ficus carica]|uniref:Uncharacterized protein n=1 Tax=Ficus carica TaxID=3494 RepID=A0AA87Z0S6_FICCA|nr:hypothetical protein TIFTF001_043983 [Ficus carica]